MTAPRQTMPDVYQASIAQTCDSQNPHCTIIQIFIIVFTSLITSSKSASAFVSSIRNFGNNTECHAASQKSGTIEYLRSIRLVGVLDRLISQRTDTSTQEISRDAQENNAKDFKKTIDHNRDLMHLNSKERERKMMKLLHVLASERACVSVDELGSSSRKHSRLSISTVTSKWISDEQTR